MYKRIICNRNRQPELDVARGLAVIFMILIHTTEYYWNEESEIYGKIANFLGSPPSAPVFMFLLGCGIVYSRYNEPEHLFSRGIRMLAGSYVFNALVYVLPYAVYCLATNDREYWKETSTQIYDADILQFASLAFLFFALVKKLKLESHVIAVISVILSLVGTVLTKAVPQIHSHLLRAVTGLFWGTHEGSYFPFLSWINYVVAGFIFAEFLERSDDKKYFYRLAGTVSGIIYISFTISALCFYQWDKMMDGALYYHQNTFLNAVYISFVIMWMGICYLLQSFMGKGLFKILRFFSSAVTPIYCFQYILIIYISVLVFHEETILNVPFTLGLFALYTLVSYLLADWYKQIARKLNNTDKPTAVN